MCGGGGGGVLIFSIYKDWGDFWGYFFNFNISLGFR